VLAERGGAAAHVELVLAAAHGQQRRELQRLGLAPDLGTGGPNPVEPLAESVRTAEPEVELGGVPRGELRSTAAPTAADDERRVRRLHRLGQGGRVLQRVVPAGERVPFADRSGPQAGDYLELLFQPV